MIRVTRPPDGVAGELVRDLPEIDHAALIGIDEGPVRIIKMS